MSRKIKLTQNKYTIIDDWNYERLNQYKWFADCDKSRTLWYAGRRKNGYTIKMHRLILSLQKNDGKIVDHINHNGLDNREQNIRIVSHSQNMLNRKKRAGVDFHKHTGKWRARITVNHITTHIGLFKSKRKALKAYKNERKKLV